MLNCFGLFLVGLTLFCILLNWHVDPLTPMRSFFDFFEVTLVLLANFFCTLRDLSTLLTFCVLFTLSLTFYIEGSYCIETSVYGFVCDLLSRFKMCRLGRAA